MNPGEIACYVCLSFFFLSVLSAWLYNRHLVKEIKELDRKEQQ